MRDPSKLAPVTRARRSLWMVAAYLGAFAILLAIVSYAFLLPALDAIRGADTTGRRQLSAVSILLLAIILFICFAGLVLTFRIGRFFFPSHRITQQEKTLYVDAWTEAGKRLTESPHDDKQ